MWRFGSCFQWIVGENSEQRKAPLTVDMDRWADGAGGGIPFTMWYLFEKDLNKPVNSVSLIENRVGFSPTTET